MTERDVRTRRAYRAQKVTDLGDGVWSVPVPIPGNPLGYTLVYAVESPAGPVLIDAGWNHPEAFQALESGLAQAGIALADLRGVVVTHYHPDHAGLAGQVREASGGWIAMHEADAEMVRMFHDMAASDDRPRIQTDMLRRAGASPEEVPAAVMPAPVPPAMPDVHLADGALVDLPGRRLRTVWTPGHSPGHICLHLEDGDRVFTGDHVLPGITPHIGMYPYDRTDVDPLGEFLTSLGKIATFGPLEALPAHEWTFTDVAARAGEIVEHHEEKLTKLVASMTEAGRPLTIWTIASLMTWNRRWEDLPPMLRGMAAGEAAAHLRTLEVRGLVRRTGGDPVTFVVHS